MSHDFPVIDIAAVRPCPVTAKKPISWQALAT
jgi:hypothetical protein